MTFHDFSNFHQIVNLALSILHWLLGVQVRFRPMQLNSAYITAEVSFTRSVLYFFIDIY